MILHLAFSFTTRSNKALIHTHLCNNVCQEGVCTQTLSRMKQTTSWLAVVISLLMMSHQYACMAQNPLAQFSAAWNNVIYKKANTAAKTNYLSSQEKQIIYILNLARMNPPLFASTAVSQFPARIGDHDLVKHPDFISLLDTLKKLKPLPLLYPDSLCWVSAKCHATSSGEAGYAGHERVTDVCNDASYFSGECCHYGYSDPFSIVLSLLVDEDVPSLGHRKIMLLKGFTKLGVALAPHTAYGINAVLDFD
jgi:hypothetical protein